MSIGMAGTKIVPRDICSGHGKLASGDARRAGGYLNFMVFTRSLGEYRGSQSRFLAMP